MTLQEKIDAMQRLPASWLGNDHNVDLGVWLNILIAVHPIFTPLVYNHLEKEWSKLNMRGTFLDEQT